MEYLYNPYMILFILFILKTLIFNVYYLNIFIKSRRVKIKIKLFKRYLKKSFIMNFIRIIWVSIELPFITYRAKKLLYVIYRLMYHEKRNAIFVYYGGGGHTYSETWWYKEKHGIDNSDDASEMIKKIIMNSDGGKSYGGSFRVDCGHGITHNTYIKIKKSLDKQYGVNKHGNKSINKGIKIHTNGVNVKEVVDKYNYGSLVNTYIFQSKEIIKEYFTFSLNDDKIWKLLLHLRKKLHVTDIESIKITKKGMTLTQQDDSIKIKDLIELAKVV